MLVLLEDASTVLVGAEMVENEGDKDRLEQRVRAISGRSDARVVEIRKRVGQDGRTIGYEVDIR